MKEKEQSVVRRNLDLNQSINLDGVAGSVYVIIIFDEQGKFITEVMVRLRHNTSSPHEYYEFSLKGEFGDRIVFMPFSIPIIESSIYEVVPHGIYYRLELHGRKFMHFEHREMVLCLQCTKDALL